MRRGLSLWWLACVGLGSSVPAEALDGERPVLTESGAGGSYQLRGSFRVDASPHLAWLVLTDFDGLPRFVHSVRVSRAETAADGTVLVDQEFEGRVMIFTRDLRVRLAVQETPESAIAFRDLADTDFERYQGHWTVTPTATGAQVDYALEAKPRIAVPAILASGALKGSALEMLGELRDEIARRARLNTADAVHPSGATP